MTRKRVRHCESFCEERTKDEAISKQHLYLIRRKSSRVFGIASEIFLLNFLSFQTALPRKFASQ